jgi:ABC-type Fe3+ transport system permease subunit/DNA-binding beta-propeller fold protein YncE
MNWPLVLNSLMVSAGATALAVAGGFLAALWFAGLKGRGRGLFLLGAIAALALPPFLATNCWIDLLGETGRWKRWLPLNIYTLPGAVWILALLAWPITFLLVTAAWRRVQTNQLEIDPYLEKTALIRWLLLPLSRASLAQASVLTFVLSLNNFAVPAILQVKVFPAEIWVRFNTTFDYASALALSWPMFFAPLILASCFRGDPTTWSWNSTPPSPGLWRQQLGRGWNWAGAAAGAGLLAFALGVPMWQLGASARTWRDFWPAISANPWVAPQSIGYAAVTATCVTIVAFLTWRWPLDAVLWLPFFLPGVLLGIALIWIFNRSWLSGIYQSAAIVILAYGLRYAALGWNGIARAIRATDRALLEMAQMEGASAWQILRHVRWPQISGRVAAAWYVTYLLCLWDVETIVLIVPPGGESLALRVFNLLHYGHNSQVNALCLWLMILAVAPLLVWWVARSCAVRLMTICLGALLLVAGCSADERKSAPVQSQFFSSVQIIGGRGAGLGEFNKPRSLALDANDNLYVVDMTARIQKFSPDGVYLMSWQIEHTEKGKPKGMNRDKAGNIIVVEPHYSRVNQFSTDGKLLARWGIHGTNVGQLGMPRGAAVDSHGDIFVCEYELNERVQHFTPSGDKCLGAFGHPGDGPGELNRAENLDIDSHDLLHVADSCNHRIQIFSEDGKFVRAFGKPGAGVGEFSYPYDIRIDKSGMQFVAEFGNSRIQIFSADDQPLEILGKPGAGPGEFSNPWSMAFDSKGNLYVADSLNNRVQKFIRKP